MKKVLSALVLMGLLTVLTVPAISLAQEEPPTIVETGEDLIALIETIGNWVFTALLAIAVIMLILAGFFWITAGGDPANVKKASDMLRNSLIGVAVALGAKGLVAVITNILGG